MMDDGDVENMVTGKELRQRYAGGTARYLSYMSGGGSGNEQKISEKGKMGKVSNSKEILTAASIAIAAVLTITLLLVFAIYFFKIPED
jgi:hypothetical protein